jgi:hypothetical protein
MITGQQLQLFFITSVAHVSGKLWNVVYQTQDGQTDFETVEALDHEEAYHMAVKILNNRVIK